MVLAAGLINQTGIHAGTTIALLGYREWTFLEPILFGDTLRVRVTIENKRETKKADRGILMRQIEILNQRGEVVQRGYADLMVKRKPS
jgi:acyl dehydratase